MLINLLLDGDLRALLIGVLLLVPSVVICLTIHECAHGLAAFLMGDRTAARAGRLTLDPMAHIDPWGFLCLMLFGFGWARPVPVNLSNFKNRRLGDAVTALAGPLSNFVLAFVAFFVMIMLSASLQMTSSFSVILVQFFWYLGALSTGLGVFNLLPIHPLDGSHVLNSILPFDLQRRWNNFISRYQSIILLVVILILWRGGLSMVILYAQGGILGLAQQLASLLLA